MPDGDRYEFTEGVGGAFTPPTGRFDVLIRNGDGTFDLTLQRSRSKMRYDANGKLLSLTDDYGNALTWTYDGSGKVQRIADSAGSGRYLDVFWGADGRISSVRDHTSRDVEYRYTPAGGLDTVTDPANRVVSYSYDTGRFAPRLTHVTDFWGRVVTDVTYDASDRVTSYTDKGELWTYSYGYGGNPGVTAKTDSTGNRWTYPFTTDGLVTSTTPPGGGGISSVDYDLNGLPLLVTDPVGVKTAYTYNAQGSPLTITRDYQGPTAVRFDFTYDPAFPERMTAIRPKNPANGTPDPNWQGWEYEFWPQGSTAPGALRHAWRLSDGLTPSLVASYEYNGRGQLTRQTSALGGVTDYEYDSAGNVFRVTGPANNDASTRPVTVYGADALGRITEVTDAQGHVAHHTYDNLDRVLTTTLPPPSVGSLLVFTTTYDYDNFDGGSSLTFTEASDPNGLTTRYGYDQHGFLVRVVDALGRQTIHAYAGGLLNSITDANGNVTSYGYDARRRLVTMTWPDGAIEGLTYWDDGLLRTRTDRRNQAITYNYDRFKRLQSLQAPSGAITYTHLGQKLTQVVDTTVSPSETHLFGYDALYRVTSETQGPRGTITRIFNPDDSHQSVTVQGGPTAAYTYYLDGSLNTIAWTPVAGVFKYEHTLRGQLQRVTMPNGQRRDFSYDDQGRLLQLDNLASGGGNLAKYVYTYDLNHANGQWNRLGQRVSMTATVPSQSLNNHLTKYEYDSLSQLIKVTYPNIAPFSGEIHSWTYDGIGNRLTNTVNAVTQTYTYQKIGANPNNWQRLLSDGVNAYGYDANGNTATRSGPGGNFIFGSDVRDRLESISGAVATSYDYDYRGRRAAKTSGTTTAHLYDGLDLVRESGGSAAESLFGPGIDEPLATFRGGQAYYYTVDGLGSVSLATNVSGVVQNKYLYDAWGQVRSQTGSLGNPFGYTAREFGDAGSWFYRARHYQPSTGRFLSEDLLARKLPAFNAEVYRYVLNSPMLYTDPLGLEECEANVYRGAPHEYRPRVVTRSPWVLSEFAEFETGPFVGCVYIRIVETTKFLRQLVRVTVVCRCPSRRYDITEWSRYTEREEDFQDKSRTVPMTDPCPRDPDFPF